MVNDFKGKNIVFLVIDSLSNYNRRSVGKNLMPFLTELEKKSGYFPNMFSEAPYTEAAVMSMLCGKNTLNDGGYFYRFDNSYNMFDYFKENGYDVYNYIQPHVFPSSITRGNTHYYCNVCYDFNVLWEYRLYLYAELFEKNKLEESDYSKIIYLLNDNFEYWNQFFEDYLEKNDSLDFISANIARVFDNEFIKQQKLLLEKEISKYHKDNIQYINHLLQQKKHHDLFKIGILNQAIKIEASTKEWIVQNYKDVFKQIYELNRQHNLVLSKINLSGIWEDAKSLVKNHGQVEMKNFLKNFMLYKDSVFDKDLQERLYKSDSFKSAPSIHSHIKHFDKELEKHSGEVPFFSCIHVDDIHNPEIFFTYDTDDTELLEDELKDVKNVLANLPDEFTGSVTYYLSLAYIDKKIKELFDILKQKKLLKDTVVFITGDHGFSFDYCHIRNSYVNNHYLENYNVPFYIYSESEMPYTDERICSSSDILPTLLDMFGMRTLDTRITGKSLLQSPKEYVVLQNVMGGCPDLNHRIVSIGILKGNELLVGESDIKTGFRKINLTEYYDLEKDPYQKKNLITKFLVENKPIFSILKKEFANLLENIRKEDL